jgi:uncharacterized membrane protein (TIGR02234 family)
VTGSRERTVVALLVVAVGGLALLASTQTFSTVQLVGRPALPVSGQGVAPALAPLGIVLVAAAAALTIAGRVARAVLGAVLVLLGAGIVLLTLPTALDPLSGTKGAIIAATGIGGDAVLTGVRGAAGSAWPVVAAVSGLFAALLGAGVLVRSPRWPSGGRRFRAESSHVSADPVDEWDALTRGTDPTAPEAPPGGPPSGPTP